jgi:cobalt-precorrin-5B (C1)-methyltransferase
MRMDEYRVVNGKRLRKGYSTGSCAAAAAKAAVWMLVRQQPMEQVEIDTPAGLRLKLSLTDVRLEQDRAGCAVVKDGGDDPDVTTGLKIVAEAVWAEPGIHIAAGRGIGVVTEPGLKVPVGQPAINPVPHQMICKEVGEVLPAEQGVKVTLSVPGGETVALRTFNPKLGVVGGISILGSKGIVEPMSEEALKESLALELRIRSQKGLRKAVFVFGNYGEEVARQTLGLDNKYLIKIGNYLGSMLDAARADGFETVLVIGHLGKLVKVAAGIFQTHSRVADARLEILCAYAALAGASLAVLQEIINCRTTAAVAAIIERERLSGIYERIVNNASRHCRDYTGGALKVGVVLFNETHHLLACDPVGKQLIEEFR